MVLKFWTILSWSRKEGEDARVQPFLVIPVGFLKRHAPYRLLMHSLEFVLNADRFNDFHFKEFRGTPCWQHFVFGEYAWARNIVWLKPFALKRNSLHIHGPKPLQTIQTCIFISSHSSNLWDDINNNRSLTKVISIIWSYSMMVHNISNIRLPPPISGSFGSQTQNQGSDPVGSRRAQPTQLAPPWPRKPRPLCRGWVWNWGCLNWAEFHWKFCEFGLFSSDFPVN